MSNNSNIYWCHFIFFFKEKKAASWTVFSFFFSSIFSDTLIADRLMVRHKQGPCASTAVLLSHFAAPAVDSFQSGPPHPSSSLHKPLLPRVH